MKCHRLLGTVIACFLVFLAGSIAHSADLSGDGTWQSGRSKAIGGAWKATLTRSADGVTGEIALEGSNVLTGGAIEGTMDGSSIVLGILVNGSIQATFEGTLDGTEVRGKWNCDAIQDNGIWYGTLTKELEEVTGGE